VIAVVDAGAPDTVADRTGVSAGIAAYTIWGLFPLVFHRLGSVAPLEVLAHRIVWSLAVVLVILRWRGPHGWLGPLRRQPREVARLASASLLIAVNWLVYIWSVDHDHVVEAALGYYVNPLLTVALGVAVLGERLRRPQVVALAFGAVSVVVLTVALGRPPWIALVLAASLAATGSRRRRCACPPPPRWPWRPPSWPRSPWSGWRSPSCGGRPPSGTDRSGATSCSCRSAS